MTVYVDLAAMLNFGIDFLLILSVNRLCGHPPEWKRGILAAAVGGIYSGMCLLPGFHFLGRGWWRGIFLGLLCIIAFGFRRDTLRRGGLFLLLSMTLGGIALAFSRGGILIPLASAGGLWFLCGRGFPVHRHDAITLPLQIRHGRETVHLTALYDTGNRLKDPISGEPVMVIGQEAASRLTGLNTEQLRSPIQTLAANILPGLRLIPCRTVAQDGGMLLAMRFSDVVLGNRKTTAIVAFSPVEIGRGEGYQALLGGGISWNN